MQTGMIAHAERTQGGGGMGGGGRLKNGNALDYEVGVGGSADVLRGEVLAADLGDGDRTRDGALHRGAVLAAAEAK